MQNGVRVKWIKAVNAFEQSSCQQLLEKKEKHILQLHYFQHFIQHFWPCFSNISWNLHLFLSFSLIEWKICANTRFLLCKGWKLQCTYLFLSAENLFETGACFRNVSLSAVCWRRAELTVGSLNTSWYCIALVLHETAFVFRAFTHLILQQHSLSGMLGNASFCACLYHVTISCKTL